MRSKKVMFKFLKNAVGILLMTAIIFSTANIALADDKYQIYNYEMRYHLKVPAEYQDKIADIGSTNININFTDNVYLFIQSSDYYASLSAEEQNAAGRNKYTLGNSIFDQTYNSPEYMRTYFENLLGTLSNNREIVSIVQERLNGEPFWVCSYTTYNITGSSDTASNEFTGEGKIYFNITKGYLYQLTLYSAGASLSETPAAVDTLNTFTIGRIINFGTVFIWIFIIAAALALITLALMQLNVISFEEQEEIETLDLPIEAINAYDEINSDAIKKARDDMEKGIISKQEFEEVMEATKLASYSTDPPKRELSDEETKHKKQLAALRAVDSVLRVFDSDREEKTVILNKVDSLLDVIKSGKKPLAQNDENIDNAETKIIPNIDENKNISAAEPSAKDSDAAYSETPAYKEQSIEEPLPDNSKENNETNAVKDENPSNLKAELASETDSANTQDESKEQNNKITQLSDETESGEKDINKISINENEGPDNSDPSDNLSKSKDDSIKPASNIDDPANTPDEANQKPRKRGRPKKKKD